MVERRLDYPYGQAQQSGYAQPPVNRKYASAPAQGYRPAPAQSSPLDQTQVLTPGGFKPLSKEEREEAAKIALEAGFSFDGYQVVRREFFSHRYDPTLTIKGNSIIFNNSCISKLEQVVYVQILVNPIAEKLVIRPCDEGARDAIRWCVMRDDKRKSRQITCGLFTAKLYDMMGWEALYEMMSLSIIGAAILNIDAIAFGDDMWSSSGNYHQWDFPQLNLAADGLNSISRSTRTYTDAEGKPAEFTYRWAASINGNQYAIVFDVETPTDVDYVVGKRYAECNGVRVDNAWLTIYDFQEFMDSTAAQVETNTTLVNETVQKVENALPNALQAEEKVNAFMTASDARIEDMESRVNSAISDIEVLTKGFNYLEVEW